MLCLLLFFEQKPQIISLILSRGRGKKGWNNISDWDLCNNYKNLGRHKGATISQTHDKECNWLAKHVNVEAVFPFVVEVIYWTEEQECGCPKLPYVQPEHRKQVFSYYYYRTSNKVPFASTSLYSCTIGIQRLPNPAGASIVQQFHSTKPFYNTKSTAVAGRKP